MNTRFLARFVCMIAMLLSASCKKDAPVQDDGGGVIIHTIPPPTGLVVAATSPHELTLRWVDTSGKALGYILFRKGGTSINWQLLDSIQGHLRVYRDTGLQCQTTYYYILYAFDSLSRSMSSNAAKGSTDADSTKILTGQANGDLFGVAFSPSGLGVAVGAGGIVIRSTDYGLTWNGLTPQTTYDLHGVAINAADECVIVGDHLTILQLHNEELSKVDLHTSATNDLAAVTPLGVASWVSAGAQGIVLHSPDNGANWIPSFPTGVGSKLDGVAFISDRVGIAVGGEGAIIRTTDGGSNWTKKITSSHAPLSSVAFSDTLNGVAVGLNTALHTGDGGMTWQALIGIATELNDVAFLDGALAVAVGPRGALYRTIDGGVNWTHGTLPTQPTLFSVRKRGDGNGCIAVGAQGIVIHIFPCGP